MTATFFDVRMCGVCVRSHKVTRKLTGLVKSFDVGITVKALKLKIEQKSARSLILALKDDLAFIPLFIAGAVFVVLFFLLLKARRKSSGRVSLIVVLADVIAALGCLYSAFSQVAQMESPLICFAVALALAAVVLLPYCITLCTFEPRKIDKLVPHSVNAAEEKSYAEAATQVQQMKQGKAFDVSEEDSHALKISYSFAAKASDAFSSEDGVSLLLDFVNKTVRDEVKADGGALLMVDDFEDVIAVRSFDGDFPPPYKLPADLPHKPMRVATNFKFASFPLRENIFGEIATAGRPELIDKPLNDARIFQNGPEEFLECGSYLMIPLKIEDSVIGLAAFARKKSSPVFTANDLKTATTIMDFATASIKSVVSVKDVLEHNELLKEAALASKVQQTLHPTKLPVLPSVQIGAVWNPCEGVCGDYYDVIAARKDRITFVMSDIAGKGMNSAVVMAMFHALLRLVVNTKQSAQTILEWVNHGIAGESFSTDHFASCALVNYDPTQRKVEVSTAGGTPVYYYSKASREIKLLSKDSEPIGVDKDSVYENVLQDVESGDILLTYTDGLIEALNAAGAQYPKENLLKIVSTNAGASAKDIANLAKSDIKKFSGSGVQHDDQSLLVIKF